MVVTAVCAQTKLALPTLARLIHSNDEEVLTDACWALSYLSDGSTDMIQAIIEANVCRRLVELLMCPPPAPPLSPLKSHNRILDRIHVRMHVRNPGFL